MFRRGNSVIHWQGKNFPHYSVRRAVAIWPSLTMRKWGAFAMDRAQIKPGTTIAAIGSVLDFLLSPYPNPNPFVLQYAMYTSTSLRNDIVKIKNVDDAVDLYNQMLQMRPLPNVIQFTQLLGRLFKMNHCSPAISIYRDMRVKGTPTNDCTMNIVINCYCLVGRVDFGFSVLGTFFKRGFVPDVTTFSTLLKGHFLVGRISQAQELFLKILYEKLCQPNLVMHGTVINGLCKAGNTSTAIEFLRLMEIKNWEPDTIIYSTVIDSLCKDKVVDKALSLLHEMIRKGIPLDVVTYNCLIHGLCNLGKWKEVKNLWNEMIGYGIAPNIVTYTIIIDSFCKEGLMRDAEDVFQLMVQRGETPNIVTYGALMDGYCLQGQIDEARQIFDTMVAKGLVPDLLSYNILINGYFGKMKMDEAMNLFRKLPRKGLSIYTTVLKGLFRMGKCVTAREVFNEMQADGLSPDFHTYCVLLDGLCKTGHVDEALELLQTIEAANLHITMYSIILDGLCKTGRLDIAQGLFNSLSVKGLYPNVVTYTTMIASLFAAGLLKEAKVLFLKMEENGCLANHITFSVIVKGLLRTGEYDEAEMFLEEMARRGFSLDSSTFSTLIDLLPAKESHISLLKIIQKFEPDGQC